MKWLEVKSWVESDARCYDLDLIPPWKLEALGCHWFCSPESALLCRLSLHLNISPQVQLSPTENFARPDLRLFLLSFGARAVTCTSKSSATGLFWHGNDLEKCFDCPCKGFFFFFQFNYSNPILCNWKYVRVDFHGNSKPFVGKKLGDELIKTLNFLEKEMTQRG